MRWILIPVTHIVIFSVMEPTYRYRLLNTTNPLCLRYNRPMQTSIKWKDLNPKFHEHFEIDVTNENAILNIQVKDKDIFGEDDFMGQIEIGIRDFKDGKVQQKTYLLKGEDVSIDEGFDRGEIEIRCRWAERSFEDDIALKQSQSRMATRIAGWARKIIAQELRKKLAKDRGRLSEMVVARSIKMQSLVRMRLGRLQLRLLRKRKRCCIKIQTRVRIRIATKKLKELKVYSVAAVQIQRIIRGKLARLYVQDIVARRLAELNKAVTMIQRVARRMLALQIVARMFEEVVEELDEDGDPIPPVPYAVWRPVYGYDEDPYYRLRRIRRLVMTTFKRLLGFKHSRGG
jgi:C2 domain/IQ calmodulin-binding motif